MLEREAVKLAISGLLEAAERGQGRALFVLGDPGMGKTEVLDHACGTARSFLITRAGADVMEASLPLALAALLGLGAGTDLQPGAREAAFFAALQALTAHAAEGPVLLAVDDVQWADPDSLALLSFLCRRIGDLRVGVIATLRPWPPAAHDTAINLSAQGHASIERLPPLSDAASGQLLGEAADAAAVRSCAGNPLLLHYLVSGAGDLTLPRFTGVPPAAFRYAEAAAILGPRFRPEVAAEVAGLDDDEEEYVSVAAVTGSGLVRPASGSPGEAEFVQPLLARLLYDGLGAPVRASLHRRAASALARRGNDVVAAEHVLRAHPVGDLAAVDLIARVGRAALRNGDSAGAARLLRAAVELAGDAAGDELLLTFGSALVEVGRHGEAIALARRVRRRGTGGGAVQARAMRLLGHAHYASGQHDIAGAGFQEAVRLAEHDAPAVAVESLLLQSVLLAMTLGPGRALAVADQARRLSAGAGDALALRAAGTWGYVAVLTGQAAGAEATVRAVAALDTESRLGGLPPQAWRGVTMYGAAAKYLERFADSERIYRDMGGADRHGGSPAAVAALCTGYAETLVRVGRLDQALALGRRACGAAGQATHVAATLAMATLAHILLLTGRPDEGDEWWERAEAAAIQGGGEWLPLLRVWDLRGMRLLRRGLVAEAAELYARCAELAATVELGEPCVVPWAGHAISAFAASRRAQDAAQVIDWLRRCSGGLPCRWPRIAAAAGQAALDERAGRHDAADAGFNEALALHGEVDLPLDRVETLIAYGAFLRRRGRLVTARPALAEAVRVAEAAGAVWLAAEARDELALAGGRRRRASDDALALTPSESRVARLAAGGAGNRDIAEQLMVSVNTVESHLRRVYAKLGIRSRRELIVRFALGDDEDGVSATS
jgi:DNA-binding NarL/FixJ family response regulator